MKNRDKRPPGPQRTTLLGKTTIILLLAASFIILATLLSANILLSKTFEENITAFTFSVWTICLVILSLTVSLLTLHRLVMRRLMILNRDLINIDKSGGEKRVLAAGNDEIASLGDNINLMLESISKGQRELEASHDELVASHTQLEQKVQERTVQLKVENEINRTIFATIPSVVFLTDKTGLVLKANSEFYRLVGIAPNRPNVLIPGISSLKAIMPDVATAVAAGKPHTTEFRYGFNGSARLFKAEIVPVEERALCVIRDVTEDRDKEGRLYLTDRLSSVGEMAAGVAHELNNPLTSIVSLAELALEQNMPEEVKEDLRTISSEAQRAGSIVKNLLSFARRHAPVKAPVQMNRVIDDVLKLRAYEHNLNGIKVELRLDPELPEVMADYFQMQQVFLNLILNAEQAMLEAMSWRSSYNGGNLTISSEQIDGKIKLSFADDGPGIPEANLTRIFDPFFTTKEVGKGTGLGLSICYGIVTSHGGRIYAQSGVGKGAAFIVELPVKIESKEESNDGRKVKPR